MLEAAPDDLDLSDLIPLVKLPDHLPKRPSGKPVALSAVYRWAGVGVRGRVLRTAEVGGFRYTHPLWIKEFIGAAVERLNAAIANGWTGCVFPEDKHRSNHRGRNSTKTRREFAEQLDLSAVTVGG